MSEKLEVGFTISTKYGINVVVESLLGEGGQGLVYKVNYGGESKALKWYKKSTFGGDSKKLRDLIEKNIDKGSPSKEFLWPKDITDYHEETFGYIMDLRPEGYYDVSKFMLGKQTLSFKNTVEASMNIVKAFRILHLNGFSYQDMNDGNFFINPDNGKVLICDNDNVAPENTSTGILGKPGYMAPEIVLGKNKPNKYSDRFSLSVILFILLCRNRPLDGKRVTKEACMTPALDEKLYGSEALFIMDKDDDSNGPDVIHKNVKMIWPCLPSYIKEMFWESFSQKSLQTPNARPEEVYWLDALIRFRSDIINCPHAGCGNEIFSENGVIQNCDNCGKAHPPYAVFEFPKYTVPAVKGTRIYRHQFGACSPAESLLPKGNVVANPNDPTDLRLKNLDEINWIGVTPSGAKKDVKPKENIPLKSGITIKTGKIDIKIK